MVVAEPSEVADSACWRGTAAGAGPAASGWRSSRADAASELPQGTAAHPVPQAPWDGRWSNLPQWVTGAHGFRILTIYITNSNTRYYKVASVHGTFNCTIIVRTVYFLKNKYPDNYYTRFPGRVFFFKIF